MENRATDLKIAILKQQVRNLEDTLLDFQVENIMLKEERDRMVAKQTQIVQE